MTFAKLAVVASSLPDYMPRVTAMQQMLRLTRNMAVAAFDTTRPTASPRAGRLSKLIISTISAIAAWNDARITRNALSRLSAHELEDIGLTYADINAVASRSFR